MIVTKKVKSETLVEALRGTEITRGTALTNTAASPNIQDLTTDAFAEVSVGDRFYISGEDTSLEFLVSTKTDDNNLILDTPVAAAHSANGIWRAVNPDYIDADDLVFPPQWDTMNAVWVLVFEQSTFA